MMIVRLLLPTEKSKFTDHLKRLDFNDRMMRFESAVGDAFIDGYVDGIDVLRDAIVGAFDDDLTLRGGAHVAFANGIADLGLSVEPSFRRRGAGTRLLQEAITWARLRGVRSFSSQCLIQNRWMMRKCRELGFSIEQDYDVAFGSLRLAAAEPGMASRQIVKEQINWLAYGSRAMFKNVGL